MHKIITISREFGSGGREIGKRLADQLGYAYYDREIITMLAASTGMCEQYIENQNEKGVNPYPFQFAKSFASYAKIQSNQTDLLVQQQKVIKQIAEKGNCIIVGRGADVILKEYHPLNLFVYADVDSKIKRCLEKGEVTITPKALAKKIKEIDVQRKKYHDMIAESEWGKKENYHLCINTSQIEIKTIIKALAFYIENWFGRDF